MGGDLSGVSPYRRSIIALRPGNPAAGQEWTVTVPAGHIYLVKSVQAVLTTSAAVASRVPALIFASSEGNIARASVGGSVAANSLSYCEWMPSSGGYQNGPFNHGALPEYMLQPGWTIGSLTYAMDAGDTLTGVRLVVIDTTIRDGSVDVSDLPEMVVQIVG